MLQFFLLGSTQIVYVIRNNPQYIVSVSYTHLDVYKRQPNDMADIINSKDRERAGITLSLIHI